MNTLFLISGPSGSGKTTIMRRLGLPEIVSFTTRTMRPGEVDGRDYWFISRDEYERKFAAGELAEWSEYSGNWYGITMDEIDGKLSHSPAFAIVDTPGRDHLLQIWKRCVSIYIYASQDDAAVNLVGRGEHADFVRKRLSTYWTELDNRRNYDYVVRNVRGKLNDAIDIVRTIIRMELSE